MITFVLAFASVCMFMVLIYIVARMVYEASQDD